MSSVLNPSSVPIDCTLEGGWKGTENVKRKRSSSGFGVKFSLEVVRLIKEVVYPCKFSKLPKSTLFIRIVYLPECFRNFRDF